MSMNTYLQGRLRNTSLPRSHGLLPLFEAVVNSIQAISARGQAAPEGKIEIKIKRTAQQPLQFDAPSKRGAPPLEPITSFIVLDNGCGFNDENLSSFQTLDSDYKASEGCRGVGRLLWLKAFESVNVRSDFLLEGRQFQRRTFRFNAIRGIEEVSTSASPLGLAEPSTSVELLGFRKEYRDKAPKTTRAIANAIFEHCLWYFVRPGGAPKISVRDGDEIISLEDVYTDYMLTSAETEQLQVKTHKFELTHLKLKSSISSDPFIAWCAASRVAKEESLRGQISGLHGRLHDENGEFLYACYVSSELLDKHVRAERFGFDIEEEIEDDGAEALFPEPQISLSEIRKRILKSSEQFLDSYLVKAKKAAVDRVEKFVSEKAPRYRPILARIAREKLSIDATISDRDLELVLHKILFEIEASLLTEAHSILEVADAETPDSYRSRLKNYLEKVEDVKKSDLAGYVFHRKVVIDPLQKAIQKDQHGKYSREDLIHEVIMPMKKTSNEISSDGANLWLIDERLAFHNYLASDKTLAAMPITGSDSTKEPDIIALNVFDEPLLVSEGKQLPLASIVVVEIKRPMRNDAASGEEKDPIEQALGYLERVRIGNATTATGRPIPHSSEIPGFCYVVCDLTPTIQHRCKMLSLRITADHQGYFGYNDNFKAYIEVISYDKLLNGAQQRNRAFFDKLGLPAS